MLIENSLWETLRFFHINALSSTRGLKVAFDLALMVIVSVHYRALAHGKRGWADAQARQFFPDMVDRPAPVKITPQVVTVSLHKRAHLPILVASKLLEEVPTIPWWNNARPALNTRRCQDVWGRGNPG